MSKKIRVLIVDDSLDIREILQSVIRFCAPDMEVIASAANGLEGIELTKEYQPDIVLMDINLPGIDGIAATKTITQEMPLSQIILMSGEAKPENIWRSRQAGARHLFTKPIDSEELLSTIRTIYEPAVCAG